MPFVAASSFCGPLNSAPSNYRTNKEADRQNAMMLIQILMGYYQRVLELVAIAADPQAPPEVKEVAIKIAEASGEVIDRTIRTFDSVRDPALLSVPKRSGRPLYRNRLGPFQ